MNDRDRKAYEKMLRDSMRLADAVGAPLTSVVLPKVWVAPSAKARK